MVPNTVAIRKTLDTTDAAFYMRALRCLSEATAAQSDDVKPIAAALLGLTLCL